MKTTIKILWTCAVMVALCACDNTESRLEKLVPADACGVVRIDVPSIVDKAGLANEGDIILDDELLDITTNNYDNLVSRLVRLWASGGIDVDVPTYLYFDNRNKPVALLVVDDSEQLITMVEEETGKSFVSDNKNEVKHLRDKNYSYSLQENVLLLRFVLADVPYEADQPANYYNSLKTSQGLLEKNEEIADFLHEENDVNAYLTAKCIDEVLPVEMGPLGLAALPLFKGHDFNAMRLTLNFDSDNSLATLVTTIEADDNSAYTKFLSQVLVKPSASFLEVVPASMEHVVGVNVNGAVLAASPQFDALVGAFPLSHRGALNVKALMASVDGPLVMASSPDPYTGETNFIFTARSKSPLAIIDSVSVYAELQGQEPMHSAGGDLIYDYGMRQMTVGARDSIFFVKALTYDDSAEDKLTHLPDVTDLFSHSLAGIYGQARLNGKPVGIYTYGLKEITRGEGLFYTVNDQDNVTVAALKLLCSISPAPVPAAPAPAEGKLPVDG